MARAELAALEARGLRRVNEPLAGPTGPTVQLGAETLINLCANDYLGLATDPGLIEAARRGLADGTGAGASRLVTGTQPAHARLEAALARFEHAEAAVLFNSGYMANVGVVQTLAGPEDAVFSDALNHASLIDGARLSRAAVKVYRHLDVDHLALLLTETPARRQVVVTDTVFSMDGDLAPLEALVGLCERTGALLVADEAHATGVYGATGGGLCAHLGLQDRVDVRVGTLSKAAGSFGAFAAGSRALCDLLINQARAYVFTTALPPSVCAASEAALERIAADHGLRERLWHNIRHFAAGLRALGLPAEPRSPIFPVIAGTPERALGLSAGLRRRGVLVKAIRPPTVPEGTSRLRIALSAAHTQAQLDQALSALGEAWREV
jgi:8-amino-7-oxononanoate synthase